MALAAKQASLHLAVDTTSGVKPSDVAKALKRNGDKQSERVSLPPPPPTPPSESGGLGGFTLPPPPDPHGHMTFDDVINLPPPPDDMMGEYPTLPPPTSFAEEKGNTPKPTKTKGDLVTSSAHDSGVDDVITRTSALKSIETISVVSSTSNISSEEGSDPGVSLTYDKGEAPITLTKVNFGSSEVATPVVCDITKKPLHEWDVAEVGRWLVGIGLGTHAEKFAENEIDGSHLPQLGKDELSELGVTRVGHRLNFERSLKKLS
uniref:SAM domain-containing protein n=2 Tax=Ciona intestinalis TaxID=7719 RepID=F6ZGD0_CIOIN